MDQMEEWRYYKDTPYQISNLGRVKREYKNGNVSYVKGNVNYKGYLWIDTVRRPVRNRVLIHQMVAECFIDNPENKPFIDHINGDKTDNRVDNLRRATNIENTRNHKIYKSNTSGMSGITRRSSGSWRVRINIGERRIHIGDF